MVSALVYEARRDDDPAPQLPPGRCRDALNDAGPACVDRAAAGGGDVGLDFLREPDLGLRLAAPGDGPSGHPLDAVLRDSSMAPGDFVRWVKQLIDLLDQIARRGARHARRCAATARAGVDALRRGVVAYSVVA